MKSKALAVQSIPEAIEKRAKRCQLPGHSRSELGALLRNTELLICVLGTPFASGTQTDQTSWANVSVLQAGQKIQVVDEFEEAFRNVRECLRHSDLVPGGSRRTDH
jgi:hypothetical protein